MRQWLSRFIYLPSLLGCGLNAIIFLAICFLEICYDIFGGTLGPLAAHLAITDNLLADTIFISFLMLAAAFAVVFLKVQKFYICRKHITLVALGSTLLVAIAYAVVWSLIQLYKGNERFVLFHPHLWQLQSAINNLKYGCFLFLFSAISVVVSGLFISGQSDFDFTPFRNHWKRWKGPVEKLDRSTVLTLEEHTILLDSTNMMIKNLALVGHVQPVSRNTARDLLRDLQEFDDWYHRETDITYANCRGLDAQIRPVVRRILCLC